MFTIPRFRRVSALSFGRRQPFTYAISADQSWGHSLSDDLRLFATTFAGGLLFMTVYLA